MSEMAGILGLQLPEKKRLILAPGATQEQTVLHLSIMAMRGFMLFSPDTSPEVHGQRLDTLRRRLIDSNAVVHGERDTKVFTVLGIVEFGSHVERTQVGADLRAAEPVYEESIYPEILIDFEEPFPYQLAISGITEWQRQEMLLRHTRENPDSHALAAAAQVLEPYANAA